MTSSTLHLHAIRLTQPVVRHGQKIETVSVRKVFAGDLLGVRLAALTVSEVDALITVLPRCTIPALTEDEILGLSGADLVQLAEALCVQLIDRAPTEQGTVFDGVLQ